MRPVVYADMVAAARALLALPEGQRRGKMQQMLDQAAAADLYRKRLGRGHPLWGNGCLMAVASRRPAPPEPFLDDPQYCKCLILVLETLLAWRAERAGRTSPGTAI